MPPRPDRRGLYLIEHAADPKYSPDTRSTDSQMLFLANLRLKTNRGSGHGKSLVYITTKTHNGSSHFTGEKHEGLA